MRELIVDVESSTTESLFLRDQDGHEYRLAVTDELRALIARGGAPADAEPDGPPVDTDGADIDGRENSEDTPDADAEPVGDDDTAATAEVTLPPVSRLQPVPDVPDLPAEPAQPVADEQAEPAQEGNAGSRQSAASVARERERSLPKPDPLFSNPLTMRPRDIQERIRSGASTQELADEMQVAFSRVEPYAHPVMLERTRMAEIAKRAHPVRDDGPAKLTLWEVLAAAFGTRGHSLAGAEWDAYKEPGNAWVVRISWRAGLSENLAEWVLRNHHSSSPTAEARDAVAADLTDPNFMQPVRSLSPISRGERYDHDDAEDAVGFDDGEDTIGESETVAAEDGGGELEAVPEAPAEAPDQGPEEDAADQARPAKRRRKSVTPHWEDVLLGVRSNTKRPRG